MNSLAEFELCPCSQRNCIGCRWHYVSSWGAAGAASVRGDQGLHHASSSWLSSCPTAGHSSACQRHWWYLWENVLKKRQNAERKRTTQRPKQQEGHHRRTATTPKGLRAMDGPLSVEEMTMKKGAAEEKSEEQGATE